MKKFNSIVNTILSKKNQYKLVVSFILLLLVLATGTASAGGDQYCC